jgi:hypothetical protein
MTTSDDGFRQWMAANVIHKDGQVVLRFNTLQSIGMTPGQAWALMMRLQELSTEARQRLREMYPELYPDLDP